MNVPHSEDLDARLDMRSKQLARTYTSEAQMEVFELKATSAPAVCCLHFDGTLVWRFCPISLP